MLNSQEKRELGRLAMWQYREVPAGYRRVSLFLQRGGRTMDPSTLEAVFTRMLPLDAAPEFTLEVRGLEHRDHCLLFEQARTLAQNNFPGRCRWRVFLDQAGLKAGLFQALESHPRSLFLHLGGAADIEIPPLSGASAEAEILLVPEGVTQAVPLARELLLAGYAPVSVEPDPRPDWSADDLERLEHMYFSLESMRGFFREQGFSITGRGWICRSDGPPGPVPHCRAGAETCAVDVDGLIYPCARFAGGDQYHGVGDAHTGLWFNQLKKFANYHPGRNRSCGGGSPCHEDGPCQGGCAWANLLHSPNMMDGQGTICRARRAWAKARHLLREAE